MAEEDELRACPLLGGGGNLLPLDLVLVEIWNLCDYQPWKTSQEIDRFVHGETHNSCGEDIVLHVLVPALCDGLAMTAGSRRQSTYRPEALEDIQVHIILG